MGFGETIVKHCRKKKGAKPGFTRDRCNVGKKNPLRMHGGIESRKML